MRKGDGTLIDRECWTVRLSWFTSYSGSQLMSRSKAALNQIVRTLDHEVSSLDQCSSFTKERLIITIYKQDMLSAILGSFRLT
jgi:hypothetical protein